MKKIYFVIAAAAMMMAGCEKQAENEKVVDGINSFELNIQGFSDASGAKTRWDDAGLWWDENGNDFLVINGESFQVIKDGNTWKAISVSGNGVDHDNGSYYVAYPSTDGASYEKESHTYGPVLFDGTTIPLAAVTTSNSITLYPCCAVIKGAYSVGFYSDSEGNPGCSGEIYTEAYINTSNATLVDGTHMDMENWDNTLTDDDGDGYIIIPLAGNSVTAFLDVDGTMTTRPVELQKGHIYVIGN